MDNGYAMAALLVSLGIMSIMMSVALPVWRKAAQREKEAELVFRGEQYARAVGLFQRKFGGAFPPNLDILLEQKFLRKKYKDPIANDDFQILFQASTQPGVGSGGAAAQPGGAAGQQAGPSRGTSQVPSPQPEAQMTPETSGGVGSRGTLGARGGITGVTSKSKAKSMRLYKGRGQYNEWQFVYMPVTPQGGTGGDQQPGVRPQRGQQPRPGRPTPPNMPGQSPPQRPGGRESLPRPPGPPF